MLEELSERNKFIRLECVSDEFKGRYEINKFGEIRDIFTKKILKIIKREYPSVLLSTKDKIQKPFAVHILLAKIFIPNPDPANKKYVDHIDRDKNNYSLDNLRWVTCSENNKNRIFKKKDKILFSKLDNNKVEIEYIKSSDLTRKEKLNIYSAIKNNCKYNGFYWNYINTEIKEFQDFYGDINCFVWKEILGLESSGLLISNKGLLKTSRGIYTLGSTNHSGYKTINIQKKCYRVHRLVYETFVLGRKLLPEEIIDHIDTNRLNNDVNNLRLCKNQSENINNLKTLRKLRRSIKKYSLTGEFIKEYSSIYDAIEELGLSKKCSALSSCAKGHYISSHGYLWCYSGEEHIIQEKLKKL